MACEQTFAWLSQYKKILLAKICAAQNASPLISYIYTVWCRGGTDYISQCYADGKRQVQPKVQHTLIYYCVHTHTSYSDSYIVCQITIITNTVCL